MGVSLSCYELVSSLFGAVVVVVVDVVVGDCSFAG